ncbi:MAG: ATP-binding protein [bacterium]|nr:ATP-binding protein [bacterium]MDT8396024.1 ATP-binding protein [bacterium]
MLDGGVSLEFVKNIELGREENTLGQASHNGRDYYFYHYEFEPWGWHIVLLKDVSSYSAILERERNIQLGTGMVVLLAALLLYFSLRWNIHRPLRQIVKSLSEQGPLQYTGVDEFEYLSSSIGSIVSSLEEREQFLASVFDSIQDGISILDADLNVVRVNRTMEQWYRHIPSLVGKKCYEVYHGRDSECDNCPSIRTLKTGRSAVELVPRLSTGELKPGLLSARVITSPTRHPDDLQRESEPRHHHGADPRRPLSVFRSFQCRPRGYIKNLAANLFSSYKVGHDRVRLELQVEHTNMVIDTAIPCGIIINELISNALEHGFPDDREGTVTVRFRSIEEKDYYYLEVSDDGIGLPPEVDISSTTTLGMQLVKVIVEQLAGTLEVDREHGLSYKIYFSEYLEAGTILY